MLLLQGCTQVPSVTQRINSTQQLMQPAGGVIKPLKTETFTLLAYGPDNQKTIKQLTVYIEGDGLAWVTRSHPSDNPTPINPVALKLALADPSGEAVYLARPCQYITDSYCSPEYWLQKRFAPEVIKATCQALDLLKSHYRAEHFTLVGYSGGAAVAALVAAARADVTTLITVAGNLDHRAWTRHHQISTLEGSLNPVDFIPALSHLEQWHLSGAKDEVIPTQLTRNVINQFPDQNKPHLITLPEYNHQCCWSESWPEQILLIRKTVE